MKTKESPKLVISYYQINKIKVPEQYHRGKKLMEIDRLSIRLQYKSGMYTYQSLADKYSVSASTIQGIVSQKAYSQRLAAARTWQKKNREYVKKKRIGKSMELRNYKKNLIVSGKITFNKFIK